MLIPTHSCRMPRSPQGDPFPNMGGIQRDLWYHGSWQKTYPHGVMVASSAFLACFEVASIVVRCKIVLLLLKSFQSIFDTLQYKRQSLMDTTHFQELQAKGRYRFSFG